MRTAEFLELMFGRCAGVVTLFARANNHSERYTIDELDEAETWATGKEGIYFNVATHRDKSLPPDKRGTKADCYELPCLWADLDLAGKPDAKKSYPPREIAEAALAAMPLPPSLLVASGGGLYPIWLLAEPLILGEGGTPPAEAETHWTKPWQDLLRAKLAAAGAFALDSTHDVTRMLRVVGSRHPSGAVVDVVSVSDGAYQLADIEPFVAADPDRCQAVEDVAVGALLFSPVAVPPFDRFTALMENDVRFKRTWARTRTDLRDDSPSGYEMALADAAAAAGWEDQECVDLIVAWRRKEKCLTDDAANTIRKLGYAIRKARRDHAGDLAARQIEIMLSDGESEAAPAGVEVIDAPVDGPALEMAPDAPAATHEGNGQVASAGRPSGQAPAIETPRAAAGGQASGGAATDGERAKILTSLSMALGVRVKAWRKIGNENAQYVLVLADGEILMGSSKSWIEGPNAFIQRLYDQRRVRPKISRKGWPALLDGLAKIAEEVQADELGIVSQVLTAVEVYTRERSSNSWDAKAAALPESLPIHTDAAIYVAVPSIQEWMTGKPSYRIGSESMISVFHALGFAREGITGRIGGKVVCRSYYRIPRERLGQSNDQPEEEP